MLGVRGRARPIRTPERKVCPYELDAVAVALPVACGSIEADDASVLGGLCAALLLSVERSLGVCRCGLPRRRPRRGGLADDHERDAQPG